MQLCWESGGGGGRQARAASWLEPLPRWTLARCHVLRASVPHLQMETVIPPWRSVEHVAHQVIMGGAQCLPGRGPTPEGGLLLLNPSAPFALGPP